MLYRIHIRKFHKPSYIDGGIVHTIDVNEVHTA